MAAYQVTLLDELNVGTALDHFAGDLVTENHVSTGETGATAHHVLIGTADIGGGHLHARSRCMGWLMRNHMQNIFHGNAKT